MKIQILDDTIDVHESDCSTSTVLVTLDAGDVVFTEWQGGAEQTESWTKVRLDTGEVGFIPPRTSLLQIEDQAELGDAETRGSSPTSSHEGYTASNEEPLYWLKSEDRERGPFSFDTILSLWTRKEIPPSALLRKDGNDNWTEISQLAASLKRAKYARAKQGDGLWSHEDLKKRRGVYLAVFLIMIAANIGGALLFELWVPWVGNIAIGFVFLILFNYAAKEVFGQSVGIFPSFVILFIPIFSLLYIALLDRKLYDAIKRRQAASG